MASSDLLRSYFPQMYHVGFQAGLHAVKLARLVGIASSSTSTDQVLRQLRQLPFAYKEWWINLAANDPIHVLVETTLLLSIVYILVSRSKDWRELEKGNTLTNAEQEELLQQQKENTQPLAPASKEQYDLSNQVVVHKWQGKHIIIQDEKDHRVTRKVLNFATFDFLGMSSAKEVRKAALQTLDKYGCGSCGPRGFYGTIDVHLQLEQEFSRFLHTDGAILYSDGASTCSSTVAAFCKRGDLLVVDEGVYEPLLTGVTLSRANVKYFKHNDMRDLRNVLQQVQAMDKKLGRKPNAQRRFIVAEGLYKNTGTIVPLDELVALKHEFHYRLILDESFSFGTLGPTGRGVIEMYGQKIMHDAEIVTVSMENSMGSIGGITVGTDEVVDHQRLSGSGYCFSASSPPFTATAAMASLSLLEGDAGLKQRLDRNREYCHSRLVDVCHKDLGDLMLVMSDRRSPIFFCQVADLPETQDLDELGFLRTLVDECLHRGAAVATTGLHELEWTAPGIRMTVSALHTLEDIDLLMSVWTQAVKDVMDRFRSE